MKTSALFMAGLFFLTTLLFTWSVALTLGGCGATVVGLGNWVIICPVYMLAPTLEVITWMCSLGAIASLIGCIVTFIRDLRIALSS